MENNNTKKRGPKPKQLIEATYTGIPVGRDKKVINPEEVYKLAALGCKNRDIGKYFGVEENSIARNFVAELEKGREDMKISLRRAMLNNACQNNHAAVQIFLAKNFLGMSDNPIDTEENTPLPWTD